MRGVLRRQVLAAASLGVLLPGVSACGGSNNSAAAQNVFSDPKTVGLANAALTGDAASVRQLVSKGASLSATGKDDVTLLEWALLQQSKPALTALLAAGANPSQPGTGGKTVLHLAAEANDPSYLQLLLQHGADPNAPNGVTQAPPIDAALMNMSDTPFNLLLQYHADPNRADRMGDTPLHVAAEVHKTECILKLLAVGADPTLRNKAGKTFQTYFNILPAGGLSAQGQKLHDQVDAWLRAHNVPIEQGT